MVTRSMEKLHELILYVTDRLSDDDGFGTTRLTKLLFWIDFEMFRRTGRAVTGSDYIKKPYGPMLMGLDAILDGLAHRRLLRRSTRPVGPYTQTVLKAIRPARTELFTSEELELIDQLIEQQRGRTAKDVSDFSHEFIGWQVTPLGERIPYGTVWITTPPPTEEDYDAAADRGRLRRRRRPRKTTPPHADWRRNSAAPRCCRATARHGAPRASTGMRSR